MVSWASVGYVPSPHPPGASFQCCSCLSISSQNSVGSVYTCACVALCACVCMCVSICCVYIGHVCACVCFALMDIALHVCAVCTCIVCMHVCVCCVHVCMCALCACVLCVCMCMCVPCVSYACMCTCVCICVCVLDLAHESLRREQRQELCDQARVPAPSVPASWTSPGPVALQALSALCSSGLSCPLSPPCTGDAQIWAFHQLP